MGADENSILKKCGEILINIKLKTKKTKTYTFNCVFCNENWDQFKKFSSHLEVEHFQEISDESEEKSLIFEPEIKLEVHLEHDKTDILKQILTDPETVEIHEDPLEPIEFVTTSISNVDESLGEVKVKNEREDILNSDDNDMDFEDALEDKEEDNNDDEENDSKPIIKGKKRIMKTRQSKKKIMESSDGASDDSNDIDFDIKEERKKFEKLEKSEKLFKTKTKSPQKPKKDKKLKTKVPKAELLPAPESELCSESEKELIKALFEALEKQTFLYDVNEKKHIHDKQVFERGYEKIANQVNEKLNTNITGEMANKRLSTMRIKYSYELEKQRDGEPHQIPWYSEHMKFLEKSVNAAIRSRMRKRINKRAIKMDEGPLQMYIDIYKKNEGLYKLNNIAFGINAKRDEIINNMLEDLKANHNPDATLDTLQDYIKYINRLYYKDKELQLKCELENREFTPQSQFYQQLGFLEETQGPFKCAICNEIIAKFENFYVHVGNHTNNMLPFKCPQCEKGFKQFDKYIIHAKRHLNIHAFNCSFCGKGYPFKSELDWHLTSHTGDKPYLCSVCGAGFRARHIYDNHIRRHEKRFRYECHICKHGFNHLHHLNDHVASHLNIRQHICNICGKAFTADKYLKNHKLIHDNTKRYKCDYCGKEFAQTAGLRQHRKQHQPHLSAAEIKRKNEDMTGFHDAFNF